MGIVLLRLLYVCLVWFEFTFLPWFWATIPTYLPFYLLAVVVIYAAIKGRKPVTVISPFHLPPDSKLPFGEYTVANALGDAFANVHRKAEEEVRARSGGLIGVGPAELAVMKLPELSRFEVPTPFTVEVKGLSHEALISLARKVWGLEHAIWGDVITGDGRFQLLVRSDSGGHWSSGLRPSAFGSLQDACQEVALRIVEAADEAVDPTLVAAREIAHKQYKAAYDRVHKVLTDGRVTDTTRLLFELAAVLRSDELSREAKDADSTRLLQEALCLLPDSSLLAYNQGFKLFALDRDRWDDAMASYRKALQLKPDFHEAHHNLGVALAEKEQFDEAIAHFQEALELEPDFPMGLSNLGLAFFHKGQLDEAIAKFQEALDRRPDDPDTLNKLGEALRRKGQLDDAIASFRKALELKTDDPKPHYNLGLALYQKDQLDEAIASYRKALQLRPDYPNALNNLGLALAEKGQVDGAITHLQRALELEPNDFEILNNLGNALTDKGELDEAIVQYQKALQFKPDYAKAHHNLALALRKDGREEEAQRHFAEAQRLDPSLKPPEDDK